MTNTDNTQKPDERADHRSGSTTGRRPRRRAFMRTGVLVGTAALAGCTDILPFGGDGGTGETSLSEFRGSGAAIGGDRQIDAPSVRDLPSLSGPLMIYLGGGEGGLYTDLLDLLKKEYPEFEPSVRPAPSAQHANTIVEEMQGGSSPADVFWSVDAGSLGVVADAGHTVQLPDDVVDQVPEQFRPGRQWVGTAGRARAIPYNTEQFTENDIPNDISALPETDPLPSTMGWAPTYGAFQAFVTAMRILSGENATREWLRGMLDAGVSEYNDEFMVSNAVADGELGAGFANHYYALRVQASRSGAPIDLSFTSNDAGALINTAGVAIISGTDRESQAQRFVRHLLSAEAQEFFATRTFAYPMVSGVPPVGDLPPIAELNPPDIDLQQLADVEPTLSLMREVGVL